MDTLVDPPEVEYLDGHPNPKMSPKATHMLVQGAFGVLLRELGGKRGKSGPELRCRIGAADGTDTLFVPDVSFISIERWNALDPKAREEPPFAPDVVVEVRSPGENARFRKEKIARYLATGATLVFDADPRSRALHVHSADGLRTLHADDRFEDARLPWLAFDVSRIFEDLD